MSVFGLDSLIISDILVFFDLIPSDFFYTNFFFREKNIPRHYRSKSSALGLKLCHYKNDITLDALRNVRVFLDNVGYFRCQFCGILILRYLVGDHNAESREKLYLWKWLSPWFRWNSYSRHLYIHIKKWWKTYVI